VGFSAPLLTQVSEVLVTGPGSPVIEKLDDLSGKVIHVRESSSYHENLVALNDKFSHAGKPSVIAGHISGSKIAPKPLTMRV
jgi:hypothetical protein